MDEKYLNSLKEGLYNIGKPKKSESDIYTDRMRDALYNTTRTHRYVSPQNKIMPLSNDYGDSIFDDKTLTSSEYDMYGGDVNEMRAMNEPWIAKFSAGIGRVGTKVVSELAKMPGMLGGAIGSPFMEGEAIENMFNNAWIRSIENLNKDINEESLPVYVKKAVKEGDIFKNLLSIDFWATEGADGVGYIASMLVPGMVMSKLGVGSKMLRGVNSGLNRMYKTAESAQDAMRSLGITEGNIDILNATIANTFFEAGAESGNAMRSFEQELEKKYKSGELSENEYNDFLSKKAELGRNVFWDNTAILFLPNLITNKILLGSGKTLSKTDLIKNGELVKELTKPSILNRINRYGQEFGKGFVREGFWEEGMQETSQRLRTKEAMNDKSTFVDTYLEMIKTTEGQKAIALGGLLGGPMNIYGSYKTEKAENKRGNNIINAMHDSIKMMDSSLADIYKKDKNGDYILENVLKKDSNGQFRNISPDQRVIDPESENIYLKQLKTIEEVSDTLDILNAIGKDRVGDYLGISTLKGIGPTGEQLFKSMRDQFTSSRIIPFIKYGDVGIEVLQEYLTNIKDLSDKVEQFNNAFGSRLSKNDFVSEIVSKAKLMQEDYNRVSEYIRPLNPLDNITATKEQKERFFEMLENTYLLNNSRKRFLEYNLSETNKKLNDYVSERFREESDNRSLVSKMLNKSGVSEKRINELLDKTYSLTEDDFKNYILPGDEIFKLMDENIKLTSKAIEEIRRIQNDIFDKDKVQKAFKTFISGIKNIERLNSDENKEAVEKSIDEIRKSRTQEEVETKKEESKKNVAEEVKPIIDNISDEQKDNLEKELNEKINKNKDAAEEETSYDVGDLININGKKFLIDLDDNGKTILIDPDTNEIAEFLTKHYGPSLKIKETIVSTSDDIIIDEIEPDNLTKKVNAGQDIRDNRLEINNKKNEAQFSLVNNYIKLIGYDSKNPTVFKSFSKNFEAYINNQENKIGTIISFQVASPSNDNHKKAISIFNNITFEEYKKIVNSEDLTNADLINDVISLISYLPIQININDKVNTFISGRPDNANLLSEAHDIYDQVEEPFRKDLIYRVLENNKNFNGITSEIVFQTGGYLQQDSIKEGKIPENNPLQIEGIRTIDNLPLYVVKDPQGNVFNEQKEQVSLNIGNSKDKEGYVYTTVKKPNGKLFPLKLNVKRIDKIEAKKITELLDFIFQQKKSIDQLYISNLTKDVQNAFSEEIGLFNKPLKDIKIYELLDLFIYDNPNSKYKFKITSSIEYGDNTANGKVFGQFKNNVESWLITNKRRNIDFNILAGRKNVDPKKYKQYLIDNNILSTDVVINQPLFKGSSIYINNNLKINNFDKSLNEKIKKKLLELYPEIKLQYTNKEINNISDPNVYNQLINYQLKSINILTSDNAKKVFEKGEKNNWSLDKILTELQIPKIQKEIIIDSGRKNLEDIVSHMMSRYNFDISIDTIKKVRDNSEINTQIYSNLTVPGGTNYTENEISTPLITPHIKGHAEFSTRKGIGWFRSDERKEYSKTRRILELQSDLFQKSRNVSLLTDRLSVLNDLGYLLDTAKDQLVMQFPDLKVPNKFIARSEIIPGKDIRYTKKDNKWYRHNISNKKKSYSEIYLVPFGQVKWTYVMNNVVTSEDIENKKREIIKSRLEELHTTSYDNNFLKILNKDNNWIKFFIDSIIQDSIQKGYKKVLFPKGDTASKIEGHITVEEFIKEKRRRIKELEESNDYIKAHGETALEINGNWRSLDINNTEIKQLKQEIERVEREGFEALRPIYKFYEDIISNILKKNNYNPIEVVDEYNNSWNEISLSDNKEILLQIKNNRIIGQANIKAMTVLIDSINQQQDTLPHEYAHHYIAWYRDTPLVQEAIKKWGSEEALVDAIGKQVVEQKGEAYNWWIQFVEWIQNKINSILNKNKEELKNILTDAFLTRRDLNKIEVKKEEENINIESEIDNIEDLFNEDDIETKC